MDSTGRGCVFISRLDLGVHLIEVKLIHFLRLGSVAKISVKLSVTIASRPVLTTKNHCFNCVIGFLRRASSGVKKYVAYTCGRLSRPCK